MDPSSGPAGRSVCGLSREPGGDEDGHREAVADLGGDLPRLDPETVALERAPEHRPDHIGVARLRERAREQPLQLPLQPVGRRPRLGKPDRGAYESPF